MLHECNNAVKVIQYTHILRIRTCTYVNMSISILQYKYISLTEPQLPVDYLQHSLGNGPIPYARALVTARACRIYLALRHLLYFILFYLTYIAERQQKNFHNGFHTTIIWLTIRQNNQHTPKKETERHSHTHTPTQQADKRQAQGVSITTDNGPL